MFNTIVRSIDPRELKNLEKNAHYMTAEQKRQLVQNLSRDGVLLSTPLIYRRDGEDTPVVLSGNHRVIASVEAGLSKIHVMELLDRLSPEQETAIALSHNSINGQDDEQILRELYESIQDLTLKEYSGLTDDDLIEFKAVDLSFLSVSATRCQEVVLHFLPEEASEFQAILAKLSNQQSRTHLCSSLTQFDAVLNAAIKAKDYSNIFSTSGAFLAMARMAEAYMEQMSNDFEEEE